MTQHGNGDGQVSQQDVAGNLNKNGQISRPIAKQKSKSKQQNGNCGRNNSKNKNNHKNSNKNLHTNQNSNNSNRNKNKNSNNSNTTSLKKLHCFTKPEGKFQTLNRLILVAQHDYRHISH